MTVISIIKESERVRFPPIKVISNFLAAFLKPSKILLIYSFFMPLGINNEFVKNFGLAPIAEISLAAIASAREEISSGLNFFFIK